MPGLGWIGFMARQELGPDALRVVRAVAALWPGGPVVVGVSGGADSLALVTGAQWCAAKRGGEVLAVVVDHGLQEVSALVAREVSTQLRSRGIAVEVRKVEVGQVGGLEAAARDARLDVLQSYGHPVLLGHTLDDQAEQVFLGLLRGSGVRSLAGMAPRRGPFLRPLLELTRAQTRAAAQQWGWQIWDDPMNVDESFSRVKVRNWLADFERATGRDVRANLARTARLARADADALDELAGAPEPGQPLSVTQLESLPQALRTRRIMFWLRAAGCEPGYAHIIAVDRLVTDWRGQGPIDLPGGRVLRSGGELVLLG